MENRENQNILMLDGAAGSSESERGTVSPSSGGKSPSPAARKPTNRQEHQGKAYRERLIRVLVETIESRCSVRERIELANIIVGLIAGRKRKDKATRLAEDALGESAVKKALRRDKAVDWTPRSVKLQSDGILGVENKEDTRLNALGQHQEPAA